MKINTYILFIIGLLCTNVNLYGQDTSKQLSFHSFTIMSFEENQSFSTEEDMYVIFIYSKFKHPDSTEVPCIYETFPYTEDVNDTVPPIVLLEPILNNDLKLINTFVNEQIKTFTNNTKDSISIVNDMLMFCSNNGHKYKIRGNKNINNFIDSFLMVGVSNESLLTRLKSYKRD